jgi:hypothetical protein
MVERRNTPLSRIREMLPGLLMCLPLAVFASCYDGGMDELMELENTYVQTLPVAVPEGYPVPGNGGVLTVMNITDGSVRIEWLRATDDATPQEDLEYRVYYATDPIPTAAAAESQGTPFNSWTDDLTGMDITGLLGSTVYYFNVLVRDGDMNISNYIMVSATTSNPSAVVYLFAEGSTHEGNLSTMFTDSVRDDVDDICRASAAYKALGTKNVHAFISVTPADTIKNMPKNFGVPLTWAVKTAGETTIAANWIALFSNLPDTLLHLGVLGLDWWSGSLEDGSFDSAGSCNNWADGTNASKGTVGSQIDESYPEWLSDTQRTCNTKREVLCLTW